MFISDGGWKDLNNTAQQDYTNAHPLYLIFVFLFFRMLFYLTTLSLLHPPRTFGGYVRRIHREQIGIKKGVWGESRFDFESIVKEVRRFVARMPPADSTAGLACCLRSFSALGDQRAEILPVQRPPTLAVGEQMPIEGPLEQFEEFSPAVEVQVDALALDRSTFWGLHAGNLI